MFNAPVSGDPPRSVMPGIDQRQFTAFKIKNADEQGDEELLGESADLLFHLIVLLRARGLSLGDAVAVLEQRHTKQ